MLRQQGVQLFRQGVEIAVGIFPRPHRSKSRQQSQHQQRHAHPAQGMPPGLGAGRNVLLCSPAGRQEARPLSLRLVCRRAPDDIQQPEGRVLPRRDGAQKAALPAAEHQHTIIFPLGTGGREIRPHHAAVTKRTYPIYINYGYTDTDSIRIQLPEGYVIEGLPKPLDVKSKFGSFHSGIQVKDKEIYITHRLFMRKGVYSPDEYAAFIDFRKQVAGQYGGKIILKKE